MDFKTVEQDLIPILKRDMIARCDDMALYANYSFSKIPVEDRGMGWLQKVFSDRRFRIMHGIAKYETVSRCRRKLQEQHEDLRAPADIKADRKKVEKEYKQYAQGAVM